MVILYERLVITLQLLSTSTFLTLMKPLLDIGIYVDFHCFSLDWLSQKRDAVQFLLLFWGVWFGFWFDRADLHPAPSECFAQARVATLDPSHQGHGQGQQVVNVLREKGGEGVSVIRERGELRRKDLVRQDKEADTVCDLKV